MFDRHQILLNFFQKSRVFYYLSCNYVQNRRIFCATFCIKLCNTRTWIGLLLGLGNKIYWEPGLGTWIIVDSKFFTALNRTTTLVKLSSLVILVTYVCTFIYLLCNTTYKYHICVHVHTGLV